jgi:hypothetical protein
MAEGISCALISPRLLAVTMISSMTMSSSFSVLSCAEDVDTANGKRKHTVKNAFQMTAIELLWIEYCESSSFMISAFYALF